MHNLHRSRRHHRRIVEVNEARKANTTKTIIRPFRAAVKGRRLSRVRVAVFRLAEIAAVAVFRSHIALVAMTDGLVAVAVIVMKKLYIIVKRRNRNFPNFNLKKNKIFFVVVVNRQMKLNIHSL